MSAYPFYRVDGKEVHEVAVGPIHAGRHRAGIVPLHVPRRARASPRDPPRLPAPRRRGAPARARSARARAAGRDDRRRHQRRARLGVRRGARELAGRDARSRDRAARAPSRSSSSGSRCTSRGSPACPRTSGFLPGASTYGRLRTTAINTSMRLCGSRFGRGAVRPGGSGMRLDAELADAGARATSRCCARDIAIINECFLARATGAASARAAWASSPRRRRAELGLVGMAARRSGVAIDARHAARAGVYEVLSDRRRCAEATGDCWARARLRIDELDASLGVARRPCSRSPGRGRPAARSSPALAPIAARGRDGRGLARRGRALPRDRASGRARALQGAGPVAAQLDGRRASRCAGTRSRTSRSATRASISPTAGTTYEHPQVAARAAVAGQAVHPGPPRPRCRSGFAGCPRIAEGACADGLRRVRDGVPDAGDRAVPAVASISGAASSAANASWRARRRRSSSPPSRRWAATTREALVVTAGAEARTQVRASEAFAEALRALAQAAAGLGRRLQRLRARAERDRERQLRPPALRHRVGGVAAARRRARADGPAHPEHAGRGAPGLGRDARAALRGGGGRLRDLRWPLRRRAWRRARASSTRSIPALFVPGCPPHPLTFVNAILDLLGVA